MPESRSRAIVAAVFVLLTLIWGTTWSAIVVSLQGIPPVGGVALRFGLAGLALLGVARLRGIVLGRRPMERRLWVVNGVFSFCISYGVVYWAEQYVPSGLTSVLFATFPLFTVLLAHFLLPEERLGAMAALGMLVGFGGVAVIFSEDFSRLGGPKVAAASVVMLVSPFAAAIGNVLVKRWGEGIHPISLTSVPMLMTGVVMGGISAGVESRAQFTFEGWSVAAVLYLALVGTAVTFTLYFWLLARMAASRLALLGYSVPVVAVTVGVLLLDEPLTARMVAGSVLVLAGVGLASR